MLNDWMIFISVLINWHNIKKFWNWQKKFYNGKNVYFMQFF